MLGIRCYYPVSSLSLPAAARRRCTLWKQPAQVFLLLPLPPPLKFAFPCLKVFCRRESGGSVGELDRSLSEPGCRVLNRFFGRLCLQRLFSLRKLRTFTPRICCFVCQPCFHGTPLPIGSFPHSDLLRKASGTSSHLHVHSGRLCPVRR